MIRVDKPGLYALPQEIYHSNCTPTPGLSSTGARLLVRECPAHYWWHSPLNPDYEPVRKRHFDIGTSTHLLVLEPHDYRRRISIIPFDDYKKTEAQRAKLAAYALEKIPLLPWEEESIRAMREALRAHPVSKHLFSDGGLVPAMIERSIFWVDEETGIWCKARPDFLPVNRAYLVDLKTTTSANPRRFAEDIYGWGYHQQAAWYLDGIEAQWGERPERFAFVAVTKEKPHLVSVCWLQREVVEWGRIENRKARHIFRDCLAANHWPGYTDPLTGNEAFEVTFPPWAHRELEARHARGEFDPGAPIMSPRLRLGVDAQAPKEIP